MIKSRDQLETHHVQIDLTGPDGNVFALMGHAKRFAKQLGYDNAAADGIVNKMMSGDYEHAIEVFEEHFGEFVILYR